MQLLLALALSIRFVMACESDGEVVKPRNIWHGQHVTEWGQDAHGRRVPVTLCGYVHRVRLGSGTALGRVGEVQ